MVDWIVSAAVEKLNSILVDKVAVLVDIPDEIRKLSSTFTSIQALLEDAESRRVKARSVKIWLEKVKDVAYDVDDILDEWITEALKSEVADEGDGSSPSKKRIVSSILSPVTNCIIPLMLRNEIGSRIKEVKGRLDDIEKEKNQFNFIRIDSGERERVDSEVRRVEIRDRETGSRLDPFIVGREDVKKIIVDLLVGGSSREVNEVPFVISIVGMGGLGKTTLAQLIYNDKIVEGHFRKRMWVCVSDDFDVKRITKSIIEFATGKVCKLSDLASLQDRLHGVLLRAKRFLLVLDDVWSHDSEKWDKLRLPFQAGAPGSGIIVTTRLEDVALAMGSAHMQKLDVLSDDDCWSVFKHIALKRRSKEERSKLKDIGKEIVNKCRGLPLAAKAIGSAMRLKRTRREWEIVLRNKIWNSGDVLGGILPALLLSYHDLPPALKQCFTYLSIFPKDRKIEKDTIVKLWEAQGFICSEEIGGLYFDDLLRRSLLQDVELDDDGNIRGCKMHDLVHDLAQSVTGSDCLLVQIGKQASLNFDNVRHSNLFASDEAVDEADEVAYISATLYKAHKLRTLFLESRISMVPRMSFHHWRRLRALDLSHTSIKKLSPMVGHLKHLRFLDLSHTDVEELPEEVCNCLNLQTLRLNYCRKLKKLPGGMKKMINLRHLEFAFCRSLNYLPQGIQKLTGLRTLTTFIVGSGNEGCKWGELNPLNHLQGRLEIIGLGNISSTGEAREADLNEKQQLHGLCFSYDQENSYQRPLHEEVMRIEEVLEILQPHTNLKKLEILHYPGSKLPTWIENQAFSNLVSITLWRCRGCEQLPGLGKLPSLKHLSISSMRVRKVGVEFTGVDDNDRSRGVVSFPRLETLVFDNLTLWKEWELRGGVGEVMPYLLQLEIVGCILRELPSNLPPLLQKLTLEMREGVDPWRGSLPPFLPNLKHLIIGTSRFMKSFPYGWLGQFKALETLEIRYCDMLESLPDEELRQLTMLQELKIYGCPSLIWRYRDGEEEREKIAQIPKITFRE